MTDPRLALRRALQLLASEILLIGAVLGCTAIPPSASPPSPTGEEPSSSPASAEPAEFSVVQRGFGWTELGDEERDELEELEEAYLSAAARQGWPRQEVTLIETRGPALGTVGAYLVRQEGQGARSLWILHWVLSPSGGRLERVPEREGESGMWDPECQRFVYGKAGDAPSFVFDPAFGEVVPLTHGIPWVGFVAGDLRYIEGALGWLAETAPHRLEFIQSQCIPRVLFSEAGRYLAAATASRVNIIFDREGLRLPGFSQQAQQAWFASVLYHESVHIQQFHQRKTCGLETEAYTEQNKFLQELMPLVSSGTRDDIQFIIDHGEQYLGSHIEVCD